MKAIVDEHNHLDPAAARQAVLTLKSLLETTPFQSVILPGDERVGPLPLVDSIADAPIQPIAGPKDSVPAWAVDGGSATLGRMGRIEIIAWRAGMVRFAGHRRIYESCCPLNILPFDRLETDRIYALHFPQARPDNGNGGAIPDLAGGLRWLAEWRLVEQIITEHDPSGEDILLLIDGSLRGNPDYGLEKQTALLRLAAGKNIHVMAVSKQTALTGGGRLPLDVFHECSSGQGPDARPWYRRLSRPLPDDSGWLGDVYLARLHPAADKTYRVDVNRFDPLDSAQMFSLLTSLSDDIEFYGYPYPLAAAHRLARIDGGFKGELSEVLDRALEREGIPADVRDAFQRDSHGRLNADLDSLMRSN